MKTLIDVDKLSMLLNKSYSHLTFSDLQRLQTDDPVFKDICLKLFNKYDRKSKHALKNYFLRNTGGLKDKIINNNDILLKPIQLSSISKYRQLFEEKLLECLHKTNNKGLVHHYYQPEISIYSNICQELKIKNSLKNRKKLHYFWKRNFGETIKSEVNQNYKRHAKDKTTPNKSVYNDLHDLEGDDKRTIICVKNDEVKNTNLEEHNMVSGNMV